MIFSPFHFLLPLILTSFPLSLHVMFLHILAEWVYKGEDVHRLVTQECVDSWENSYYEWHRKIRAWFL